MKVIELKLPDNIYGALKAISERKGQNIHVSLLVAILRYLEGNKK